MKTIRNICTVVALAVFAASCGQQSASLEFKTIVLDEFVKNPKDTPDAGGLQYVIHFTCPSRHRDKTVLKTLQQKFVARAFGEEYISLTPEKAVNASFADWKTKYINETDEEPLDYLFVSLDSIIYMNDNMLQIIEYSYIQAGGAHGFGGFSSYLYNLHTGEEYSRDDIFKPESASQINSLIISETHNYQNVEDISRSFTTDMDTWTDETQFALTEKGMIMIHNKEIPGYWSEEPLQIIPYSKLMPCLRQGTPVWELAKEMTPESAEAPAAMNDEQFAALIKEIFYRLPASVMPEELETEKQRKDLKTNVEGDNSIYFYITDAPEHINCISYSNYSGDGNHTQWELAGYLTADRQNVVLVIQYTGGFDEVSGIIFDKTLNYSIKTGAFTEIACPWEPFTTDELFRGINIADAGIKKRAEEFFNGEREIYCEFDKNGFSAQPNLDMFWYGGEDVFDYYNLGGVSLENRKQAYRQWDGNRFVKAVKADTDEQTGMEEVNPAPLPPPPPDMVVGTWKAPVKRGQVAYLEIHADGAAGLYLGPDDSEEVYEFYNGIVYPVGDGKPDEITLRMEFELNWFIYESEDGSQVEGVPKSCKGVYTFTHGQQGGKRTLHVKTAGGADPLYGNRELKMEWIPKTFNRGTKMSDKQEM
jgi:hypothetical protein